MISAEMIREYRCPRWTELPDIELYMDQVITVLEKNLSVFFEREQNKFVTSTMINNYVKQKIVKPPVNKKYDRGHIASFYIITLLKQIMPISVINTAIVSVVQELGKEKAYDLFCLMLENSLSLIFSGEQRHDIPDEYTNSEACLVIRSITLSYSNMLYARSLLEKYTPKEEPKKEKEEKKEKKK